MWILAVGTACFLTFALGSAVVAEAAAQPQTTEQVPAEVSEGGVAPRGAAAVAFATGVCDARVGGEDRDAAAREMFQRIDADGDGRITTEEFLTCYIEEKARADGTTTQEAARDFTDRELRIVSNRFVALDRARRGYLTQEDFLAAAENAPGPQRGEAVPPVQADSPPGPAAHPSADTNR